MTIKELSVKIGADENFLRNAIEVQNVETDEKTNELIVIEALYKLCTEMIAQRNETTKTVKNVYSMLQELHAILSDNSVIPKEKKDRGNIGFVYLASCATPDVYKIGMTRDIGAREKSLSTGNHHLKIFAYTQSNNPKNLESLLHGIYKEKNISGEWFQLSREEVDYMIQSFCFTVALEEVFQI